jgi:hypothetical protein
MARKRRTDQEHELAVSDEAAVYIADALMQLALHFENTHYAQIRRHHEANATDPDISSANRRHAIRAERLSALPSSVRFLCSTAPQALPPPRPRIAAAVARRRRQGRPARKAWPLLARLKAEPLRRRARRHA